MSKYKLTQKTDANGTTQDIVLDASCVDGVVKTVNNSTPDANGNVNAGLIYVEGDTTATSPIWTASSPEITSYYTGLTIAFKIGVAGLSGTQTTLNINGLGAKKVFENISTNPSTHYGVGSMLFMVFDTTLDSGNGAWRISADRTVADVYVRQYQFGSNAAGTSPKYPILTRYNLTNKNGTYDTAYTRYRTDVTIDTTTGNLDAPTISENGTALSSKYQSALVSGTSIKTINNESILGSGNITISGGQATDVKINGTSITSSNVADIKTNGTYNATSNKIATMSDIPSLSNYVDLTSAQSISGVKTFTNGISVSGRSAGGGDDEGIVVGTASNNYAGVCCGSPSGRRAVFYLKPSATSGNSVWRYNNGSTTYDIAHPEKAGTIALTDDIAGKQDTLVSGTNIKTINGNSILGSGDLTIGGGTSTDVQINGTSITSGGVANILTNTAYNSSTNKIATMSDVVNATLLSNITTKTLANNIAVTNKKHYLLMPAIGYQSSSSIEIYQDSTVKYVSSNPIVLYKSASNFVVNLWNVSTGATSQSLIALAKCYFNYCSVYQLD